ncbi:hypothetical protein NPX79_03720 [Spiroplasma endosymbiont of Anurida maritima]|uniref:hypothetical protein n=1 Tax=Spiroplasma endosymbiont of Anurida maritima TaxID=2967972 RepID=UPI0036D35C22
MKYIVRLISLIFLYLFTFFVLILFKFEKNIYIFIVFETLILVIGNYFWKKQKQANYLQTGIKNFKQINKHISSTISNVNDEIWQGFYEKNIVLNKEKLVMNNFEIWEYQDFQNKKADFNFSSISINNKEKNPLNHFIVLENKNNSHDQLFVLKVKENIVIKDYQVSINDIYYGSDIINDAEKKSLLSIIFNVKKSIWYCLLKK